jgi:hypothetical protein
LFARSSPLTFAEMDRPPVPTISWPECSDRRRSALLLGVRMAEAEALWQLGGRALQHQAADKAADPDLLTPAEIAFFRSLPPGTPYTPEQIERLRRDKKAAVRMALARLRAERREMGRRARELLDREKSALPEPKAG